MLEETQGSSSRRCSSAPVATSRARRATPSPSCAARRSISRIAGAGKVIEQNLDNDGQPASSSKSFLASISPAREAARCATSTIARNYAEALLVARAQGERPRRLGRDAIDGVADGDRRATSRLRNFLAAPRISAAQKKRRARARRSATSCRRLIVRFLQKLVQNRRQMLIPADRDRVRQAGRRAERARARAGDRRARDARRGARRRSRRSCRARSARPSCRTSTSNPAILGGVIVRVGDTVMDGSVRSG